MSETANINAEVETTLVPTRDGVRLATDVYLPEQGESFPVVVERTPYGRRQVSRSEHVPWQSAPLSRPEVARWFCKNGYAVVMQDCRGRYDSGGRFVKYVNEARDGLDTLAWIVDQPWCDGRILTMGLSYGAHTQLAAASLNPPGLAGMYLDSGGFANAFNGGLRRGGAFELKQATWAFRHAYANADPASVPDLVEWFRRMPWSPGNSPLAGAPEYEDYLFGQWRAEKFDDHWRIPGLYGEGHYDQVPGVPVAIVGSWYDPYALACVAHYQGLSAGGRDVRLVMGPWTHGDRSRSWAGEVEFGDAATWERGISSSHLQHRLSWFEHCLGRAVQSSSTPRVQYFRMGGGSGECTPDQKLRHGGTWLGSDCWPPASASQTLYLHENRLLSSNPPAGQAEAVSFVHDPSDPVPTIGGTVTSGEPVMSGGPYDQRIRAETFTYRPETLRGPVCQRADVLCFETDILQQDVEISGSVVLHAWISSDCPDTDLAVKLVDVYPPSADYPEGFAMNVADGMLRLRYREGFDRETWLEPGRSHRVRIEMFPTSNLFASGHRIRLQVAGSDYPQFDINFNDTLSAGGPREPRRARNTLHCSATHPSSLALPVVRGGLP